MLVPFKWSEIFEHLGVVKTHMRLGMDKGVAWPGSGSPVLPGPINPGSVWWKTETCCSTIWTRFSGDSVCRWVDMSKPPLTMVCSCRFGSSVEDLTPWSSSWPTEEVMMCVVFEALTFMVLFTADRVSKYRTIFPSPTPPVWLSPLVSFLLLVVRLNVKSSYLESPSFLRCSSLPSSMLLAGKRDFFFFLVC